MLGNWDLTAQDKYGHKLNYVLTGTEGALEMDVFQRQVRVYHYPGKLGVEREYIDRVLEWGPDGDGNPNRKNQYFHDNFTQNTDIVRRVLNGDKSAIDIEDAQETMRLCLEFTKATSEREWQVIDR